MRDLTRLPLPDEVRSCMNHIIKFGFSLTLVGGTTRDYLTSGTVGKDFDFELSSDLEDVEITAKIKSLKEKLSELYDNVEMSNKFYVIKIKLSDYDIELAAQRLESFNDKEKSYHHSDVTVEFYSNLDAKDSFKRRDFTCNAIGLHFSRSDREKYLVKVIDPFGGVDDLLAGRLQICSDSFHFDPVRYLRAIRFSLSLGLGFSLELRSQLEKMSLESLTPHYYFYEAYKVDFFAFNIRLFKAIDTYKTAIHQRFEGCRFLVFYKDKMGKVVARDHESVLRFLIENEEDFERISQVADLMQVKKKRLRAMIREIS